MMIKGQLIHGNLQKVQTKWKGLLLVWILSNSRVQTNSYTFFKMIKIFSNI